MLIDEIASACGADVPENFGNQPTLSWEEVGEMSRNGIDSGAH
jgi:hypothetical protein